MLLFIFVCRTYAADTSVEMTHIGELIIGLWNQNQLKYPYKQNW